MLTTDDLRLIRALAVAPSMAAAARLLDLTPPAVTIRLQRMEQTLKVRLAVRQSRGITLTEEGQRLHAQAVEILARIENIGAGLLDPGGRLTGSLRIVAPFGFGRAYIAPLIKPLHSAHPDLEIRLQLSESPVSDAAGADVVIHIGQLKSSSWVGHLIAPNDRVLCASPQYMRRIHDLQHPSDLPRYDCLCLRENDEDVVRWRFTPAAGGGKGVAIRVAGVLSSNDGTVITDWALAGLGIVERSEWDVAGLLAAGRLVRVLPDWSLPTAPVMALLPSRTGVSPRQKLFLDAAKQALGLAPWRTLPKARKGPR
ncbi:MAG: HTH-type transcriptional regulator DmlR [Paracidovorax wautersii]|uniref:HTH-type transcriptional regulator DmlR n=1 Tax=Paracidovorax wautersii TaxID=1177982 RepID=A0A7V8JQJ7_9BURK|nr:MAG: HTH-type transcriptional regulator DmlR [Paracidovorax wautersii]